MLTQMVDEEFARTHPVTFIPSYESLAVRPPTTSAPLVPPLPEENP